MKNFILNIVIVGFCTVSANLCAKDQPMQIRNTQGQALMVYLKSFVGDDVKFKVANKSRVYTLKIGEFDAASQKAIRKWKKNGGGASEEIVIDLTTGKSDRISKAEGYDDRRLTLKPQLTLKNRDTTAATAKAQVTVLMLGRPVLDRSNIYIFSKETHPVKSMGAGEELTMELKVTVEDYDDKGSAQYGVKYMGYVVLLHKGNKIVASKSVPSTWEQHGAMWLDLKERAVYTKHLVRHKEP